MLRRLVCLPKRLPLASSRFVRLVRRRPLTVSSPIWWLAAAGSALTTIPVSTAAGLLAHTTAAGVVAIWTSITTSTVGSGAAHMVVAGVAAILVATSTVGGVAANTNTDEFDATVTMSSTVETVDAQTVTAGTAVISTAVETAAGVDAHTATAAGESTWTTWTTSTVGGFRREHRDGWLAVDARGKGHIGGWPQPKRLHLRSDRLRFRRRSAPMERQQQHRLG